MLRSLVGSEMCIRDRAPEKKFFLKSDIVEYQRTIAKLEEENATLHQTYTETNQRQRELDQQMIDSLETSHANLRRTMVESNQQTLQLEQQLAATQKEVGELVEANTALSNKLDLLTAELNLVSQQREQETSLFQEPEHGTVMTGPEPVPDPVVGEQPATPCVEDYQPVETSSVAAPHQADLQSIEGLPFSPLQADTAIRLFYEYCSPDGVMTVQGPVSYTHLTLPTKRIV
eukprot:TRINITY_DN27491_c0_g1_i3.p1 TRINITY_DN27491_c0_g1~~TRINITY_DN27491_c0_g1_i3.p1  ORF type:complete len:231 (-),score=76.32 TRINITY_DN27491_c0_g1_i3:164-856(-)